jgi:glycosyltransferase involved in cell wall biosynthesis
VLNLRILTVGGLVPWHPEAGGGQIISFKTSEALALAGQHVHYLAIAHEAYKRQVDWGDLEYGPDGPGLLRGLRLARQLAKNTNRYEIVHVHLANETIGYGLAYALARRMGLRARLAMSIYAPRAYALPRSLGEVITLFSCHSADLVICLSDFSKRDISRAYRLPTSRLVVTYAGVDSRFTPKTWPRDRAGNVPFSLLFSGRLNGPHEQKGVDVLLRSLPLILRHHEVVLKIIGSGPRLAEYRALALKLGIGEQVRFLGFVEHEEMPSHYQDADLFVLPSRRESFGLVLAEAMACGLPVVATKVGAIPEVVEDGLTGLLVPADDPGALADAVVSLLSDPPRMQAMGTAGIEKIRERFTWDKVAQRVLDGYHSVL